ncbi:LysR family transcriptional regulator [Pseudomonas sp. NA-150]|uniref:LysR family transcriptional regulator n=1 Tax=Pseudomonas sp. NA-150 TaxID=3367525 RepID=UPI0037C5DD73
MDKFQAMLAFTRVVEVGTFTKASELLDIPKPTVTRLIQTLEKELDTKLLNRTTRRVTLTTDGAAYYDRAVRLLSDLRELEGVMTKAKSNPRGRLKVNVPAPIGLAIIIPALPEFAARYPDIQIDFGVSDRPVDLFLENVDCVVRTGHIADQSLVARRLGDVRQVLCATPEYWNKHGRPTHPEDLNDGHVVIRMISSRTNRPFPLVVSKDGERVEVDGQRDYTANDATATLALGLTGLGVIHALTFQAATHLNSGALVEAFDGWRADPIPVYIVYPPNRHLSSKVRVFVDWLAELFARHERDEKKTMQGQK